MKTLARLIAFALVLVAGPVAAQAVYNYTTGNSPLNVALPTGLGPSSSYSAWYCKADAGTGTLHVQYSSVDVVAISTPKQCNLIRWSGSVYQNLTTSGGGGGSGPVTSVNGYYGDVVLTAANVGAQPLDSNLTALSGTTVPGFVVQTGAGAFTRRSLAAGTGITVSNLDGTLGNPSIGLSTLLTAGGPTGSTSVVPVITYNAHGRLTAVTTATITPAAIGAQPSGSYALTTNNLSDLANLATARSNLGLAIGTNVQAWDTDLDAISALSTQTFGRSLLTYSTASAALSALGGGTMATQNANAVAITGGSVTGITDLALADGGTGASTAQAARANLNIDSRTLVGDADYPITATDRMVSGGTTFTAQRTWTFPKASTVTAGQSITIDTLLALTNFSLQLIPFSGDTLDGAGAGIILANNQAVITFYSNGSTGWTYDKRLAKGVSLNTGAPTSGNSTQSLTAGTRILASPLTANVNLTLNTVATTGASPGDIIEYRRPGSDSFTASIKNGAGTTLIGAVVNRTYRFLFSGTDWIYWGSSTD